MKTNHKNPDMIANNKEEIGGMMERDIKHGNGVQQVNNPTPHANITTRNELGSTWSPNVSHATKTRIMQFHMGMKPCRNKERATKRKLKMKELAREKKAKTGTQ